MLNTAVRSGMGTLCVVCGLVSAVSPRASSSSLTTVFKHFAISSKSTVTSPVPLVRTGVDVSDNGKEK